MSTAPAGPATVRVFLVEDLRFVLDATRAALEQERDLVVVGAAGDVHTARPLLLETLPDVVLLDHRLPDESGLELFPWMRTNLPRARAIVLTAYVSPELVRRAEAAGAAGYVCKDASGIDELVGAIRAVARGLPWFDRGAARARSEPALAGSGLTPAEQQVLRELVRTRATNKEIAAGLAVGESTIATHLRSLVAKSGARNRSDLARWGESHGYF
jgi:DNA-binding NarL/FixJ family response regulator